MDTVNMQILYEDNHIIAAVKPAMMPSQADNSGDADFLSVVRAYIADRAGKATAYLALIQRLDRPTSGVMVFAKTSKAAARLCAQLKNHEFKKTYSALLEGDVSKISSNKTSWCDTSDGANHSTGEISVGFSDSESVTLIDWLVKDGATNVVKVVPEGTPGAKFAELSYRIVGEYFGKTQVEIELKTGRSHQIRVQFARRGCPVYADAKYGKNVGLPLALFAVRAQFTHPTTMQTVDIAWQPDLTPYSVINN